METGENGTAGIWPCKVEGQAFWGINLVKHRFES